MTENKHMLSIDFLEGFLITHFSFCNTSPFLNDYAASQLSYIYHLSNISSSDNPFFYEYRFLVSTMLLVQSYQAVKKYFNLEVMRKCGLG